MLMFLFTLLLGPRIATIFFWLIAPNRFSDAFGSWIIPVLGIAFLPWTTLIWVIVYSWGNGVHGLDWFFVALALIGDLASYGSGGYARQRQTGTY